MTAEELIQKAKEAYPCNFEYAGKMEDDDREKIEKFCDINIFSVRMTGNHIYHIKYRKE